MYKCMYVCVCMNIFYISPVDTFAMPPRAAAWSEASA